MPDGLRVLFLAAEAEPYVKVGGLGDVAGSLPKFIHGAQEHATDGPTIDVRLVLPLHPLIRPESHNLRPLTVFSMPLDAGEIPVRAFAGENGGVPVYFVDAEPIRSSGSVYSTDTSIDGLKYTFFPLAALELMRRLDWHADVVHANDWHTAIACYAIMLGRREGGSESISTLLTIHNLPFMGPNLESVLGRFGLPEVKTGLPIWANARPLPLGLWAADAIVAVSPTYAREIQTRQYGSGLDAYLRARQDSIIGILNGIDTQQFNPATDAALAANFGIPTLDRRVRNKLDLQGTLGLEQNAQIPLLAAVSRLDPQKGSDLIPAALRRLGNLSWQAVVLGTGLPRLENSMRGLARTHADRFRAELEYDAHLASQIYAGADMLMMPSRYEPCGLSQMIAMRYGCLPIVSDLGGLRDTVQDGDTGFSMGRPTAARLALAIRRAITVYTDPERWSSMQKAAMAQDFSWSKSARLYVELYRQLVQQRASAQDRSVTQ